MPRGDGASDGVDWLTAGPPPPSAVTQRRRLVVLVLALLAVGAVALTGLDPVQPAGTGAATPTPQPGTPRPHPPTPSASLTRPVVVRDDGPILPGYRSWELFARNYDTVFRIELDSGRVTATSHQYLGSNGPVGFVAGPTGVIVIETDSGLGFAVPDGQPARPLGGRLRTGGYVLPGPPGLVWVEHGPQNGPPTTMSLVRLDGKPLKVSVTGAGYFQADGNGGLLMNDVGGVWEARPGGLRRITTGAVTAVGRRHYLLANCDAGHTCRTSLYERRTRKHRRLPLDYSGGGWPFGSISPDGTYAALFRDAGADPPDRLVIVHLRSGRTTMQVPATVGGADPAGTLAWSPDGRWLAVTLDGRLNLLEPAAARRVGLDLGVSDLVGLVGRGRQDRL